jgi:hypothetical protein
MELSTTREMLLGYSIVIGKKMNAYRLLVEKPEGRRLLGRPRRRWLDNIRMDLGEVGWGDVMWTGLVWLRIGRGGDLL